MEKAAEGIDGETRREFLPPNCHPLGSRRWLLPQAAIGPNQLWVHYVRCDDIELAEDSAERDEESPPVFLPCHPLPRFCEASNQQSALSNKGLLRGWFLTGSVPARRIYTALNPNPVSCPVCNLPSRTSNSPGNFLSHG